MSDPRPPSPSLPAPAQTMVATQAGSRKQRVGRRMIEEARRILGIFLYLLVVFGILILHEHMVLSRHGLSYGFYGLAFINAWILAKIMLVAESLDVRPHFQGRPLLYPILARSCAFAAILVSAYLLEEMGLALWRGTSLADSVPAIGGGGFRGLASAWAIMAVALIPYFTFRELGRAIGREYLHTLLFRGEPEAARPNTRASNDP
ncbi:hypothetical protein [Methylobacterium sp. 77]|uniref:hypothetical protein n=1 Tax=Methylobacterium sp. 77 TaxID=1101192 RepID=UPI000683EC3F|nr:hypothetical protein [Methylobacterium sp. 77]